MEHCTTGMEYWNGLLDYWNELKASKGPACPHIENEDLLATSIMHRADFTELESQLFRSNKHKSPFLMPGHVATL